MSSEERALAWLDRMFTRATAFSTRRPLLLDAGLVILVLAVSFIGLHAQNRLGPEAVVFGLALCLPMLRHRDYPVMTFAAIAFVAFVQWLLDPPQLADAAVLLSLYWMARDASILLFLGAAVVAEAGAVMATVKWAVVDQPKIFVGLSGLAVAAAVLGITGRQRRVLLESLQDRALRLERERDQEGRIAAAAERARIAREMHDIVSHNLTVMISLADGALYALPTSSDATQSAIERISATGRQALSEMRRLLGVLHDETAAGSYEPQPGLDRLEELLARVEAAGIPVSINVEGDPQELETGLQLTVFRVAQEALTNTLKHAGRPASAQVSLRCRPGLLELDITDTGGADAHGRTIPSAGRGLRGMHERAVAFGGELEAGPSPDGGWRVHLNLPIEVASLAL